MKVCCTCKEEKNVLEYQKNKSTSDGLQKYCKSCSSIKDLAYKEKSKVKINAYQEEYSKTVGKVKKNIREAKRRASCKDATTFMTEDDQQRLDYLYWLARDLEITSGLKYHVDHVKPLSKGGSHHPDNLQILPAHINIFKGNREDLGL